MSSPERGGRDPIDVHAALGRVGLGGTPIRADRRLTPKTGALQVAEFYSSRVGSRVLAFPRQLPPGQLAHETLQAQGLPVLTESLVLGEEEFRVLEVPIGAYSLRSRVHLVRKDLTPHGFGGIFASLADGQRRQYEAGLGVATAGELPLLDHFALVEDRSPTGLSPYLIPPYDVDPNGTPATFNEKLLAELAGAKFTEAEIAQVRALIAPPQEGGAGGPVS